MYIKSQTTDKVKGVASDRYVWLDLIKWIVVIWIFINHFSERIFGYPYIANPTPDWPPLAKRIAQLAPIQGYGLGGNPAQSHSIYRLVRRSGSTAFYYHQRIWFDLGITQPHGSSAFPAWPLLYKAERAGVPIVVGLTALVIWLYLLSKEKGIISD